MQLPHRAVADVEARRFPFDGSLTDWQPEAGSPEAKLYTDFLPVRDWLK